MFGDAACAVDRVMYRQCFLSGSKLDPHQIDFRIPIRIQNMDPDPGAYKHFFKCLALQKSICQCLALTS